MAAADFQPEALERVGNDYGVPAEHLYTDFREMIEKEKPDIISIGTQQEQRAEITVHASDAGVRGIFCRKAADVFARGGRGDGAGRGA